MGDTNASVAQEVVDLVHRFDAGMTEARLRIKQSEEEKEAAVASAQNVAQLLKSRGYLSESAIKQATEKLSTTTGAHDIITQLVEKYASQAPVASDAVQPGHARSSTIAAPVGRTKQASEKRSSRHPAFDTFAAGLGVR